MVLSMTLKKEKIKIITDSFQKTWIVKKGGHQSELFEKQSSIK